MRNQSLRPQARAAVRKITAAIRFGGISAETLTEKMLSHPGKLKCQHTAQGMIAMLEEIHNYRNQKPVAIALNVKQGIKKNAKP
jgi:hypothetical protein